jgi:hypothetical protein
MIGAMGTMTPAARMAAMLAMLQNAPGHLLPSRALWAVSADYQAGLPSGRRQYRRDVGALVARGLIETDMSTDRTPQRTGVRLLFIGKDTDWELTAEEHAALRAARERHPRPFAGTTDGRDNRGTDLDLAMDAVRILEEAGEWMMIADLAAELRQPAESVVRALRELLSVDTNDGSVYRGLLDLGDFDEHSYAELPVERMRATAARNPRSTQRPLSGYGLTALGRFAYTATETADRLALIERALADPGDMDEAALRRAHWKLKQWARRLAELGTPGSADS